MSYLQRMEKRHPGLRTFLTVLLSAAMVLNSVPTQAFAEAVSEPQAVEIESPEGETGEKLEGTEGAESELPAGEQPADEQPDDQQDEAVVPEGGQKAEGQAGEEQLADGQDEQQGENVAPLLAAPAPLTAQADGDTYTVDVHFYGTDGVTEKSNWPAGSYSAFVIFKNGDEDMGWACAPVSKGNPAEITEMYSVEDAEGVSAPVPCESGLTTAVRIISGTMTYQDYIDNGYEYGNQGNMPGYTPSQQTEGSLTVVSFVEKDHSNLMQVDIVATGSGGGADKYVLFVKAQGATGGRYFMKRDFSVSSGTTEIPIDVWLDQNGTPQTNDSYTETWKDIEVALFKQKGPQEPNLNTLINNPQGADYVAEGDLVNGFVVKSYGTLDTEGVFNEDGTVKVFKQTV